MMTFATRLLRAKQRRAMIALGFWNIDWRSLPGHWSRAREPANLYFAQDETGAFIKIGLTNKAPEIRVRELRSPTGGPCQLLAALPSMNDRIEGFLLFYFEGFRTKGEWFHNATPIREFIERVQTFADEAVA